LANYRLKAERSQILSGLRDGAGAANNKINFVDISTEQLEFVAHPAAPHRPPRGPRRCGDPS